jgi:hypothetical protein
MMTTTNDVHPALQMLEFVGREMPGVWTRIEELRAEFRTVADWPTWCFAPTAVAYPISGDQPMLAAKLTALAAWRMTKGIYRFDPTLMEALIDTPLDGDVPVDVLRRLPEWCIYLELDRLPTWRGAARGVWLSLERAGTTDGGPLVLHLLLDSERDLDSSLNDHSMLAVAVPLAGESLLTSLQQCLGNVPDDPLVVRLNAIVQPILSLLLYVCSQGAEMSRGGVAARPSLPVPVRTRRKGERLFPAAAPVRWDLGVRIGAALRAAQATCETSPATGTGATVLPHLRRAHWHTILSGPRKGVPADLRAREVRWMPPIAVNVRELEELPAVIRPVRQV